VADQSFLGSSPGESAPLTIEALHAAIDEVIAAESRRPQSYPTFPEGFLDALAKKHPIFTDRERNRLSLIIAQLPMPIHPQDHRLLVDAMDRWERRSR
jgi:hypothetical protein